MAVERFMDERLVSEEMRFHNLHMANWPSEAFTGLKQLMNFSSWFYSNFMCFPWQAWTNPSNTCL